MSHSMLAVSWGQLLIAILFVLVCVLLILIILLQKGRGGGLSGAFGGVGGHSAFGAKTGDVFTWITVALTFFFILIAVIGNWVFVPPGNPPTAQIITPEDAGPAEREQPAESTSPGTRPG
jgi:preprotein translocase subunit SecG